MRTLAAVTCAALGALCLNVLGDPPVPVEEAAGAVRTLAALGLAVSAALVALLLRSSLRADRDDAERG